MAEGGRRCGSAFCKPISKSPCRPGDPRLALRAPASGAGRVPSGCPLGHVRSRTPRSRCRVSKQLEVVLPVKGGSSEHLVEDHRDRIEVTR